MIKQTGRRVAEVARRVKDGVRSGDHAAINMGGHIDNLHKFGHAMLKIAAPHIGDAAKPIAAGLSQYEQLRGQVRDGHKKAMGVAGEVQRKALPHIGF
jgi:hypothetical protein